MGEKDEGNSKKSLPINQLKGKRTVLKTRITKNLKAASDSDNWNTILAHFDTVKNTIDQIKELQETIIETLLGTEEQTKVQEEIELFENYLSRVIADCAVVQDKIDGLSVPDEDPTPPTPLPEALGLKLPKLQLDRFSDNDKDPFAFSIFWSSFSKALEPFSNLTNAQRFLILRVNLFGRALSMIEHLSVNEDSYIQAVELLKGEFYCEDKLIDLTFGKLLDVSPLKNLSEVQLFATDLRFKLVEMEKFDLDFSQRSGKLFLSKLVRQKLPRFFLMELCRKTNNSYPSFSEFLENCNELIALLTVDKSSAWQSKESRAAASVSKTNVFTSKSADSSSSRSQNLSFNKIGHSEQSKGNNSSFSARNCRFCFENHYSSSCKKYPTFESRLAKIQRDGRCTKCLAKNHKANDCPFNSFRPCKFCSKTGHLELKM